MAEITASLVKELREKTGAGMMDCKKALNESDGDMDAAVDWLRSKGLSQAAKKAGRTAAEGLVGIATAGTRGAMVEVNAETDFVARNDDFKAFVETVSRLALDAGGDIERLKTLNYPDTGRTVEEELTQLIATIGENMNLRRAAMLEVDHGAVVSYMHNAMAPGLGRIGVLVAVESTGPAGKVEELGRGVAMHVAATAPQALDVASLDQDLVERERRVLTEQAEGSGKPADIIEKMVQGRLNKFYQEVVLLEQTYVIDNESRVSKAVEAAGQDMGADAKVAGFVRFALGEGIEKKEDDFAAEVAAAAGKG